MHISEGIDIPVYQDSPFHFLGKIHIISTLHIITHEIPYNDLLIAARQIGMCQKIHLSYNALSNFAIINRKSL